MVIRADSRAWGYQVKYSLKLRTTFSYIGTAWPALSPAVAFTPRLLKSKHVLGTARGCHDHPTIFGGSMYMLFEYLDPWRNLLGFPCVLKRM